MALRCLVVAVLCTVSTNLWAQQRPNVLWLTCEDISPNLGCYGDSFATTPELDRFARQSIRYTHAIGITGVCAVNRSCLVTGMYSSSIGTQDMRSRSKLPGWMKCFPEYLRDAGYYCTNNSKTDYNFPVSPKAWDECSNRAHWKNREAGQPFFAVFNYIGTHESQIWAENHARHAATLRPDELHEASAVPIPPFHPDTPEVRRDWANYYDNITALDYWFAAKLKELDDAGLADNTIVFFYSDHGAGMPGVKKWIWNDGLLVPLLIHFPPPLRHAAPGDPGSVTDRLVSFIDFGPTVLSLCGVTIPGYMQGKAFLGKQVVAPREVAYIIRDRMAERYDMIRGVRDARYQYCRNYMPHLPWSQYTSYTEQMPTMQVWRRFHEQGKLNAVQDRYFQTKPVEELYDLSADPHMTTNLATSPQYAHIVKRMRTQVIQWQIETHDLGLIPEYILHERSGKSSPFELGDKLGNGYFTTICKRANQAIARDPRNLEQLVADLRDPDDVIRWWSAMGLVMLGTDAAMAQDALVDALADKSPIVRVAAANALCNVRQYDTALPVLVKALSDTTPFVRLRAVNVLDRIGPKARSSIDSIKRAAMPKGTIFPADYLNRMCEYVSARLEED